MRFIDIIEKKRDGFELSDEEIRFFVKESVAGNIPEYQISALLMAICIRGMTERETVALTMEMAYSGEMCDLSSINGVTVDKHSSGGVADTVTLILAPMLAACGAVVPKLSGKGLGYSGGTIDKLSSIPGMCVDLPIDRFISIAKENGICVSGQSSTLAPADRIFYALRDTSGSVPSIPLIASSIMSKKLAAGAQCIMLDVKCGTGAFMKTPEQAKELAETMVKIGRSAGRITCALVSDMNEPLGDNIGNSLEVIEAVEVLRGKRCRLLDMCLLIGEKILTVTNIYDNERSARAALKQSISGGGALKKLEQMITAQGGDSAFINDFSLLPHYNKFYEVKAEKSGVITAADALLLGKASVLLGAGRAKKTDKIDYAAGIIIKKRIGDMVEQGDTLALVFGNGEEAFDNIKDAFKIGENAAVPPLFYYYIER